MSASHQELLRGEQQAAAAEQKLQIEVTQLQDSANDAQVRLQRLKAAASEAQLAGIRAPELSELQQRLQQTAVPTLQADSAQSQMLEARRHALEARIAAVKSMHAQVQ